MKHAINIIIASILTGGIGYLIGTTLTGAAVGLSLDEYDTVTDKDIADDCRFIAKNIVHIT